MSEQTAALYSFGSGELKLAYDRGRLDAARRCAEIAASHVDHGEFWHTTRAGCVDAILDEVRAEFGLPEGARG